MRFLGALCVLFQTLIAFTAQAQEGAPIRFDNWLYFQRNIDDSERWQYRPRFYIPFDVGGGWTFTQRLDFPLYYTNKSGPENTDGGWKAGLGDWFAEETLGTPQLSKNTKASFGVRLVFPTGGLSPFGSGQYQWAPTAGISYALPDAGLTLAPLARYFMSFHASDDGAAKVRKLDLYPTLTQRIGEGWSLGLYVENPISYNDVTNKWFVPIDAMLIRRVSKGLEYAVGGAYAMVKDDPQYRSMVYGRLTIYF
jgi:hypothetical protein